MTAKVFHGDCIEAMRHMAQLGVQVDAVVTDPPYHLLSIVKRFGKPGSAPAKFGSDGAFTRSSRGFMGQQWDGGDIAAQPDTWRAVYDVMKPGAYLLSFGGTRTYHRMACAIEDAGFDIRDTLMWMYGSGLPKSHNLPGGRGTALKPAWEPIILARKALIGTIAANVSTCGCGVMNIDKCRVPVDADADASQLRTMNRGIRTIDTSGQKWGLSKKESDTPQVIHAEGRWPANVLHDGSDEVISAFPDGSVARFFYCAKANSKDRAGSSHPTVKPIALLRYLCRLVVPPGGVVLDPFAGSGTTLQAAIEEGFVPIGIEKEDQYVEDIVRRLEGMAA